jgi:hypothetical protein
MGLLDTTPQAETLANRFGPVWNVRGHDPLSFYFLSALLRLRYACARLR